MGFCEGFCCFCIRFLFSWGFIGVLFGVLFVKLFYCFKRFFVIQVIFLVVCEVLWFCLRLVGFPMKN